MIQTESTSKRRYVFSYEMFVLFYLLEMLVNLNEERGRHPQLFFNDKFVPSLCQFPRLKFMKH